MFKSLSSLTQVTVANSYIRSWLAIDLVSSIPMDILLGPGTLSHAGYNDSLVRLHSLLRLVKMGNLVRLQRISQRLQLYFYIKNSLLTIVNIMTALTFYVHWFSCGFIYLV